MTDSLTSEEWPQKTNFIQEGEDPIQSTIWLEVAWLHASYYLLKGIQEYSQWFPGAKNKLADALTRDNDRSDKDLISILPLSLPLSAFAALQFVQLPSKITSWLTLLLL
jgi:hypothetical protein